nr:gliding motility-associated C-terminal domain-containing protein [Flavobacteriales bacterium]
FVRWEIRNNTVNLTSPSDPALDSVSITFFAPDTIIAHFKPHDYGYYVPNAFTPNNDHINDVWLPLGDRIDPDHYEVLVMDRWGERIFASTDLFLGWDGTWSGAPVPIGAYVYRISVRDAITQERHILQGSVSVVR